MAKISYPRNISLLATCQGLFYAGNAIVISTTGLVGLLFAPSPAWASVPFGLQYMGSMCTTIPASLLMQRKGRKRGFQLGSLFGMAAGAVGYNAIRMDSFAQICLAGFLYGIFWAFCQQLRFTAVDVANHVADSPEQTTRLRGKALGWVMAGGTLAALIGPKIAAWTRPAIDGMLYAGCYLAMIGVALTLGLVVSNIQDLNKKVVDKTQGRSVWEVFRQPIAMAALFTALVSYVTMNMLMTATPIAMKACGHHFTDSSTAMQWHIAGMFAPSFFTGRLIARFSAMRVSFAGVIIMGICIAVQLSGETPEFFQIGMALLGVGWNFMFIGATALLASSYTEQEKGKVQGVNDFFVFGCTGASALSAGALHHLIGWRWMNLLPIPALILCAGLLLVVARNAKRTAP